MAGDLAVATGDEDIHPRGLPRQPAPMPSRQRLRSPDAPPPPGRSWPSPCSRPPPSAAPPLPFGHPCTAQNGVRFCPTNALTDRVRELRRRPARRRRDAAADRRRPVPDDRDAARLRRQQDQLRGDQARGRRPRRRHDLPLELQLVRPPRLRGRQPSRARLRALLRRAGLAHARLRARLDPPRRPALRGPRHPAPARPARRPGRRQARRARRHRHLLRRRAEPRAGLPARPHPQPDGSLRAVAQPRRQAAARSPPRIRAGCGRTSSTRCCPTGASSTSASRARPRAASPIGVPIQSFISGLYAAGAASGFYAPPGARPRRRPHDLVRPHPGRRALRRRRARDRRRDPRAPPGLRASGHAGAAAAARRLDRRPLPRRRSRCGSTTRCAPPTRTRPSRCSSPTSATRAAPTRSTPTRALNDAGSRLLRHLPARRRRAAGAAAA